MADDPMEQLTTLMHRMNDLCTDLGLDLETFAILPSMDPHMPGMVQVILRLDPEKAFTTPEQRAFDDQFKQIAIQEQNDKVQRSVEEARQQAIRDLEEDW